MELIDGLSRLALSASSARYKECPVDFEVKTAVQEGKWCWWRPGHSGFPFQIYQALLSIWGGQLSPASLNASDWQDLAANGYQAILAADWLVQKELGRFGQVDEIERLAPRMMPCAWNYDSLYAFSSLGFEDSDTGKTHPCQYSAESEAEIAVIIMELRGSKEHQDLLESARNSEVSSTAALQNFYEFVRRNLGCKDRANPLSSCPEIHLLGMQGLAKLWNRESPLRGLERSFAKVEYDNPRPLQPFRLVVAIYANNRPHYLHQVLDSLKKARGVHDILLVISLDSPCPQSLSLIELIDFCKTRVLFHSKSYLARLCQVRSCDARGFSNRCRFSFILCQIRCSDRTERAKILF